MTPGPRVGNDVIDLLDPQIAMHHARPRFVARVCTAAEARRVDASPEPHTTLWELFAAKEAAFKAVAKLQPGIAFAPRRFAVDAACSRVVHGDTALWLRLDRGEGWVHAIAGSGTAEPVWALERRADGTAESAAVRDLAVRTAAGRLALPRERLTVARGHDPRYYRDLGPPRLLLDGEALALDLSLSHDGAWVACALLPHAGRGAG